MNRTKRLLLGAAAGVSLAMSGLAAAPALAAPQLQPLQCDGQTLTIRTPTSNSGDSGGWSAGIVVEGGTGHLIPTSFDFSAYDTTAGLPLFAGDQVKGLGQGNHNQPTVTCTQVETATLADFTGPGDELPPGTSLTDTVQLTLVATAVTKP